MSSFLGALAGVIIIFAAGCGLTFLLARNAGQIALAELIALSWLFGAAVISLSLWLLGTMLRGIWLQSVVTMIAMVLVLAGAAQWRKRRVLVQIPRPRPWIESALSILLGLGIVLIFVLTFKHTLGWDGLVIWELKARYAYLNGGALPSVYFPDATRVFSHPEYPLFLPMLETWLYFWIGDCDQYWVKLIFPIFYAVAVLLLGQAAALLSGKRVIGLIAANLFLFVPFLTNFSGGVLLGYADTPLATFYLAAFYFLLVFARADSKRGLSIVVILAAILPWIKREGMILWFVLAACGAVIVWRRRGVVAAFASLLPGIGMIAGWQIYLRAMQARGAQDFLPVTVSVFISKFDRIGPILRSLFKETTALSHWNLLWFATLFAFLCIAVRHRRRETWLLIICTVMPVALYCSTYVFSMWSDYQQHIYSSLSRLLLHVAPLSILAIALALAPPKSPASTAAAD